MHRPHYFFACIFLLGLAGCSPKTYEDCLLEKIKPGMSEQAINAVTYACTGKDYSTKSSEKPCSLTTITQSEKNQLKLKAETHKENREARLTVYNGNIKAIQNISVTFFIDGGSPVTYKIPSSYLGSQSEKIFYQSIASIDPDGITNVSVSAEICQQ